VAGVEGVLPGLRKAENPLIVGNEQNAAAGASQSLISLLERVSMVCSFLFPFNDKLRRNPKHDK
jgi:hypothetical protein